MAAVLACGSGAKQATDHGDSRGGRKSVLAYWGAALSHRSAAELWRLLPAREGSVDVSVPGDGGKSKRRGIRLHRSLTLLPADVTLREGIPVTSPARTIADLRSAVRRRATGALSEAELRRAIRQANVLGLPVDEETRRVRTRSDLEEEFLSLCERHGLPEPQVNVRVGRHLVDFLWPERMLIVETDGYRYHWGRAAFEDDRQRDLDLRRLGYDVVRIADRQLNDEPGGIARVLRERLHHGAP